MEFEGNLSSAIANHEITNFPGSYIYDDGLFNIADINTNVLCQPN